MICGAAPGGDSTDVAAVVVPGAVGVVVPSPFARVAPVRALFRIFLGGLSGGGIWGEGKRRGKRRRRKWAVIVVVVMVVLV